MNIRIDSEDEMKAFGQKLGSVLAGGEVIELAGDIGAGKTTLTKGIALGLKISEPIQSPTFTISRLYEARDNLELKHYDFYRLNDAGIMTEEITEALNEQNSIVIVEWAGLVQGVMPSDRLRINIEAVSENSRELTVTAEGEKSSKVLGRFS